jgi:hypothetical protein
MRETRPLARSRNALFLNLPLKSALVDHLCQGNDMMNVINIIFSFIWLQYLISDIMFLPNDLIDLHLPL